MILPVALALAAGQAAHDRHCDSAVTQELNACFGARWRRADAAMNVAYRAAMARMKAQDAHPEPDAATGPTYVAALLASQRAWLAYRDAECLNESYRYRGGTMAGMEELGCRATLTQTRTKQLHDLTAAQ